MCNNAPNVLCFLWKQMKVAWKKQIVPKAWKRAGEMMIPKEKGALSIYQFRLISLLNVEGKTCFGIVAQRMITYLKQNSLIDMSVQKARIPGFSGCLEDTRYNTNIYKCSLTFKAGPMDYLGKSGMFYCTWRNLSEDESASSSESPTMFLPRPRT